MAGIPDYSTTAASNATVGSVNFAEGQAPSSVNDSARALMADLAAMYQLETAAGTDTYTLTLDIVPAAYSVKMPLYVLFTNANTGAATLNVNSLGAKAIQKRGVALVANDLTAGASYLLMYDGTAFQLQGAPAYAHGADVASAGTVNLDTATGDCVDVTGVTTITAITLAEGRERTVRFTGILTLTHGASLVLPSSANIATVAGDYAIFRGYASGVVRCVGYFRNSGKPLIPSTGVPTVSAIAGDTVTTTTVLANITGCSASVTSGKVYSFRVIGLYQSDVSTVGLKLGMTTPTFGTFCCGVTIYGVAADGTDSTWQGVITASGGSTTATGVATVNTDCPFIMEGIFEATANGTLQAQVAVETVAGSPTITVTNATMALTLLN